VIAANRVPDHATIARFRQRHRTRSRSCLAACWGCARGPGMVEVGVITMDGTKMHANASQRTTRNYERIARQILGEADAVDREEDERHGHKRGDELPPELATREGRERWLRGAQRDLDDRRAVEARPIARACQERLKDAKRRLEEELAVECAATAAYEHMRTTARTAARRTAGGSARHRSPTCRPRRPRGRSI
jgi:hypothetical protein